MRFAPDTEEVLGFVVALCNTEPAASRSGTDELATTDQLDALLVEHGYTGRVDHDEAELRDVHRTRTLLRHVWTLSRDDAVEAVNKMLRDIVAAIRPEWCMVRGEFTPRGGLTTSVVARYPSSRERK